MKKILVWMIMLLFTLSLCGCDDTSASYSSESTSSTSEVVQTEEKQEKETTKKKKKSKKKKSQKKSSKKNAKKTEKKETQKKTSKENNSQSVADKCIQMAREDLCVGTDDQDFSCGEILEEFYQDWKYEFQSNKEEECCYVIFTGQIDGIEVEMIYEIEILYGELQDQGEWITATVRQDGYEQEGEDRLDACFSTAVKEYAAKHELNSSDLYRFW